jgi:hypothetical protein
MTTRARSHQAAPEPQPWSDVKARLERRDEASDALTRYYRGEINLVELGRALEQAVAEKQPPRTEAPRPS